MKRYEIIKWLNGFNISDNKSLNLVVFDYVLTCEQAEIELKKLEVQQ